MGVYICQNSSNCLLLACAFDSVLKLHLNKKKSGKLKDGSEGSHVSKKIVTDSFVGVKQTTVSLIY